VIAILGMLAAVAIPKFVDLREQAHDAAAKSIHGGFASGISILHTEWAVRGGGAVVTNGAGWPVGTSGGAGMTNARCARVWTDVLTDPPSAIAGYNPNTDGWGALGSGTYCIYVYEPDNTPFRIITYNTASGVTDYLAI